MSDSYLTWDEEVFRVCGENVVELGKDKRGKETYDRDRNPDLTFTVYDSIHGDQNQYPKQIASFFYQNHSIIFQKSLHGYI